MSIAATAPAAGLYPLWEAKEKTNFLVIVTDEEENSDYNGHFFTPLLEKYGSPLFHKQLVLYYIYQVSFFILTQINFCNRYTTDVGECKLVFVSFLPQNEKGTMVEEVTEKTGVRYMFSRSSLFFWLSFLP